MVGFANIRVFTYKTIKLVIKNLIFVNSMNFSLHTKGVSVQKCCFFLKKICTLQFKFVPLHPILN